MSLPFELALVGEEAHDGDAHARTEWQQAVVLEEDDRLLGRLPGERAVGRGVEVRGAAVGVRAWANRKRSASWRRTAASMSASLNGPSPALGPGAAIFRTVLAVVREAVDPGEDRGGGRLLVRVEVMLGVEHQVRGHRVGADQEVLVRPGAQVFPEVRGDVVGRPLTRLYTGITPATAPASTVARSAPGRTRAARADSEEEVMSRSVSFGEPVLEDRGPCAE